MRPWHLTISSVSRLPLFPNPEQLRRAVWKLSEVLGDDLALFCIVDDHVHVVVVCEEAELATKTRALTRSMRALAAVDLHPTYVRPIESRRHMRTLLDYILRQPGKHDLPVHPALWEGSCLLDLVGARRLPGVRLRISEALPRTTQSDALAAVGLSRAPLVAVSLEELRRLGPSRLLAAAAAASGAPPTLQGITRCEARARQAACRLAREAGIPLSELAWHMDITPRACRRLVARPLDEDLCEVVLRRLALEQRVRGRG